MNIDRANQTLMLPDGRKLGYAEWGDLDGKPVFFFGGSTSARFVRPSDNGILNELGVHLYTFDRPGMGLSDYQPERTLLDWTKDMRAFADAKHINRFSVGAVSGGGPYGAASAYALADRLNSVTLISAISPLNDKEVFAAQNPFIKLNIILGKYAPPLYGLMLNMMRPMVLGGTPQQFAQTMVKNLPPSDQRILQTTDAAEIMFADVREALRQGVKGATHDMRLAVNDWGFKLEDIHTKVFIWQGEADPNVPPIMARYMVARIPNCAVTFVPNAGHLLVYSYWREILMQLLTQGDANSVTT